MLNKTNGSVRLLFDRLNPYAKITLCFALEKMRLNPACSSMSREEIASRRLGTTHARRRREVREVEADSVRRAVAMQALNDHSSGQQ